MNLSPSSARALRLTAVAAAAVTLLAPAQSSAASDPLLSDQWALNDPAAIGAAEAWTQSSGAGVIVAVLDTGLQLDHPDLAANVWTNRGEIAGNGRDDDANGIVDDVHGANMFDRSGRVEDDNGHGTHVAGIVAAQRDNGVGGSGLAPAARIMPVKVLDSAMTGTTGTLAAGIRYAVDRGARILNLSVNTAVATEALRSAVRYAGEHGAIVVASAGNNGRSIDLVPSYPASLSDPAVLSVAAQSPTGGLWELSNFGPLSVNLAAPGERIASTTRGAGYQYRTGTSAAAPFVAASLALLAAARPDLPPSALRDAILATTRRGDLLSTVIGGGRLDVGAAMRHILAGRQRKSAGQAEVAAAPKLRLQAKSTVRTGARATLRWTAAGAASVSRWRVWLDGRTIAGLPADAGRITRRVASSGRHRWRVVGLDAAGEKVVAARRAFRAVG